MSDQAQSDEFPLISGTQEEKLEDGIALCLSGGGYRAMLFHLGVLWYLHDAGYLRRLSRISSVSGGSITAGVLGTRWSELGADDPSTAFRQHVVSPLRRMAGTTIDAQSVLGGVLWFGTVSDRIVKRYRELLFGDRTLQDLPDHPRFVINATSVQTGSLFRFSKPYVADWQVGRYPNPRTSVAEAVAASSAFPPVLSPVVLRFGANDFAAGDGPLSRPPFTTRAVLTDGGVYDNVGIETAWKRCKTVLVSDAGGKMQPDAEPAINWASHSLRVNSLIDNQVRSLRKRQIVSAFKSGLRSGAYWGMRTDPDKYPAQSRLTLPREKAGELAGVATRLKGLPDELQERLVNFGYGMAERAIRSHFDENAYAAEQFPYPRGI
jgi:NTE family protein